MDLDAINKRKQKKLAKAITDEDRGMNSFGITKKDTKDYGWAIEEKKYKEAITEEGRRGGAICMGAQDNEETWTM